MLRSLSEPDEPEAKTMYQNLRDFVERVVVQQVEIDRLSLFGSESYVSQTSSSREGGTTLLVHEDASPHEGPPQRHPRRSTHP